MANSFSGASPRDMSRKYFPVRRYGSPTNRLPKGRVYIETCSKVSIRIQSTSEGMTGDINVTGHVTAGEARLEPVRTHLRSNTPAVDKSHQTKSSAQLVSG